MITKHSQNTATPSKANKAEPKKAPGLSHSIPIMVKLLLVV